VKAVGCKVDSSFEYEFNIWNYSKYVRVFLDASRKKCL
jgi:hypothetical protein